MIAVEFRVYRCTVSDDSVRLALAGKKIQTAAGSPCSGQAIILYNFFRPNGVGWVWRPGKGLWRGFAGISNCRLVVGPMAMFLLTSKPFMRKIPLGRIATGKVKGRLSRLRASCGMAMIFHYHRSPSSRLRSLTNAKTRLVAVLPLQTQQEGLPARPVAGWLINQLYFLLSE